MHKKIYALSVRQPFASLIACGEKPIEWRSRPWKYRGPLVICASARPRIETDSAGQYLPTGAAIALVDIVGCRPFTRADLIPAKCADYQGEVYGYAWILENAREIEPVPVKGRLAPWIWTGPDLIQAPGWHEAIGF